MIIKYSLLLVFILLASYVCYDSENCLATTVKDYNWAIKHLSDKEAISIIIGTNTKVMFPNFKKLIELTENEVKNSKNHILYEENIFNILLFIKKIPDFQDQQQLIDYVLKKKIFTNISRNYLVLISLFLRKIEHESFLKNLSYNDKNIKIGRSLSLYQITKKSEYKKEIEEYLKEKNLLQIDTILSVFVAINIRDFNEIIKNIECSKKLNIGNSVNEEEGCICINDYIKALLKTPLNVNTSVDFDDGLCTIYR